MQSLEECCRKADIELGEGHWRESGSKLDEMLIDHPALGGSVCRLRGVRNKRTFPMRGGRFESGAMLVQGAHLVLDTNDWDSLLRLEGLFNWGLCFEECTIETQGNTQALLGLRCAREIVFRKVSFVSRANEIWSGGEIGDIPGTWLVNLKEGGSITFEECNFRNNHVQIRAFGKAKEALDGTISGDGMEGDPDKESRPDAVGGGNKLEMLFPGNSSANHALELIALHGNRDVGRVSIVSGTKELILRAGNRLEALYLPAGEATCLPSSMSLGLFEEIDPACRDPLSHKDTFLKLKQLGTEAKDDTLVRASMAQIDKIDHFLLKNDPVKLSSGVRGYFGHLQRRAILGWGYWISNFNRSWGRCLGWLILWYFGTTVLACWLVSPPLELRDVAAIVVRPLHQVPFLARAIEEHLPQGWNSISTANKVGISFIGLVQAAVTGMLTFSLVRSLRR